MMCLTIEEKRTILGVLILITRADNVIHPKEMEFIDGVMKEFALGEIEFEHMEALDLQFLRKEVAAMTEEKQAYAVSLFAKLAKADGYVAESEQALLKLFSLPL